MFKHSGGVQNFPPNQRESKYNEWMAITEKFGEKEDIDIQFQVGNLEDLEKINGLLLENNPVSGLTKSPPNYYIQLALDIQEQPIDITFCLPEGAEKAKNYHQNAHIEKKELVLDVIHTGTKVKTFVSREFTKENLSNQKQPQVIIKRCISRLKKILRKLILDGKGGDDDQNKIIAALEYLYNNKKNGNVGTNLESIVDSDPSEDFAEGILVSYRHSLITKQEKLQRERLSKQLDSERMTRTMLDCRYKEDLDRIAAALKELESLLGKQNVKNIREERKGKIKDKDLVDRLNRSEREVEQRNSRIRELEAMLAALAIKDVTLKEHSIQKKQLQAELEIQCRKKTELEAKVTERDERIKKSEAMHATKAAVLEAMHAAKELAYIAALAIKDVTLKEHFIQIHQLQAELEKLKNKETKTTTPLAPSNTTENTHLAASSTTKAASGYSEHVITMLYTLLKLNSFGLLKYKKPKTLKKYMSKRKRQQLNRNKNDDNTKTSRQTDIQTLKKKETELKEKISMYRPLGMLIIIVCGTMLYFAINMSDAERNEKVEEIACYLTALIIFSIFIRPIASELRKNGVALKEIQSEIKEKTKAQ